MTHKEPVYCAKFNKSFKHVVTASEGSVSHYKCMYVNFVLETKSMKYSPDLYNTKLQYNKFSFFLITCVVMVIVYRNCFSF